jgi:hypothetical protein
MVRQCSFDATIIPLKIRFSAIATIVIQ